MRIRIWPFAGLLLLLFAAPLAAQEVQVPFDDAGRVETIDTRLARRLGLFVDEYPGFREARLFRTADSTFVLEVTAEREGRTVRERVPLSAAEADALRRQVMARLAQQAPAAALDQDGRPLLIAGTTLLGLGFYGWAVPVALDVDDGRGAVAAYMLTAGSSFLVPWLLTKDQPVSYSMAQLSLYGGTRGIMHGALLYGLVNGGADTDERGAIATAMLTSVAESFAGYHWARSSAMAPGTAHTIGNGGDLGMAWGGLVADLVDTNTRGGSALALVGAGAGLYAGQRLAAKRDYSWGDAEVMRTSALVGVLDAVAVASLFDTDDSATYSAAALIGSAAGAYLGDRLVRDTDFRVGESLLLDFGTFAGAALGLGGAYLASSDDSDERLYLMAAGAGASIGFGAMYAFLAPDARRGQAERSAWQIQVMPQALLAGRLPAARGHDAVALPLLGVQYRFGGR
jgi:hypothetical protein